MAWYNETITTMGIISEKVYDEKYFSTYIVDSTTQELIPNTLVANGITYTVIDHTPDSDWSTFGFQALLLKSGDEYVIAFRGTEPASPLDWVNDILVGTNNFNIQYTSALDFVKEILDNKTDAYEITTKNLTLTGHSLGGMLTQQVGAALEIEGYAYNPYGMENLLTHLPGNNIESLIAEALYNMMSSVNLGSAEAAWAKDHILNVSYNDFGFLNGDPLSNFASQFTSHNFLGAYLPIFGANGGLVEGHDKAIINKAIAHYNEVLEHFTNKDFLKLSLAYMSTQSYEKVEAIFNDLNIYHASGLSFNFLLDYSASDIISAAKSDNTVLYALLHMNPFAIVGNLPAYTNLNPDDYSDMFFEDRAQYLYYSIDPEGRYYDFDTGDMTTFYGYDGGKLGTPISYKYILFGDNEDNQMNGGNHEDHLYGMGGDDTLNGGDGDDYIEGGKGADQLIGGTGFDTYISGNADTIYDSDGSGEVYFDETLLTGGKKEAGSGCEPTEDDGSSVYKGNGGTYTLSGDT